MQGVGIEWGSAGETARRRPNGENCMNIARAFALVFVAMTALALACGDDAPPPASEPIAADTAALTPTAVLPNVPPRSSTVRRISEANADAVRIYSRAIGAMNASSSHRMQLEESIDFGDGRKVEASTDTYFQFPDTGKTKSVLKLGAHAPIEIETILIDGFVYTKKVGNPFGDDANNGRWIRERERGDTLGGFLYDPISMFWPDAEIETERLNGVETFHLIGSAYSGSLLFGAAATSPASTPLKTDAWIGVDDGHIHRITAATAATSVATETVEITAVFSDFDMPDVVEAPKDYYDAQSPESWSGADVKTNALSDGWMLSNLPDYGFSVSTPLGWTFFGAIADSFYDGMEYYLAALSQEAAYTAIQLSFIPKVNYSAGHRMTGYEAGSEGGDTHVSALIVNIAGVLDDAELSAYVDDRMEQTENNLIITSAIDRRAETLPDGDAERVEFAYQLPNEMFGMESDDGTEYAQIQYFILSDGDAYILTFATTADRMDAMRATFEEIARTARAAGRP